MCFPSKASFGTAADLSVTGIEEKFERKTPGTYITQERKYY